MKLTDIKSLKGTYVALKVLPESAKNIVKFCEFNGIPVNPAEKLHVTVLYSTKPHQIVSDPDVMHSVQFTSYDLFDLRANEPDSPKVLVAKIAAPSVVARHLQLMAEHDATFDYPVFLPHITISYNFTGNIADLPPLDVDILLGGEWSEELDLGAK